MQNKLTITDWVDIFRATRRPIGAFVFILLLIVCVIVGLITNKWPPEFLFYLLFAGILGDNAIRGAEYITGALRREEGSENEAIKAEK